MQSRVRRRLNKHRGIEAKVTSLKPKAEKEEKNS